MDSLILTTGYDTNLQKSSSFQFYKDHNYKNRVLGFKKSMIKYKCSFHIVINSIEILGGCLTFVNFASYPVVSITESMTYRTKNKLNT